MAQNPWKGLFARVLPDCNFGSRAVPAALQWEEQAKSAPNADQIELSRFTQSWIVMLHCSRAGNVRQIWEGYACEIEMLVG
ncbi:hypothetical protein QA645_23885 [Bradyrhizobium sp. CIAT3101]|uniref:hypothetical protein n=1 Tax=Bradyrhizobium sp. CIAT3101 TaxID=439387 RepID=UPI0024B09CE5|nr:hypothetical protein [Bradyrhizobium sp. CIAT3101]WFU85705.1 hypothetical protein QA645_23885 [Bradyrhizobium sp. CIAT3101]